MADVIEKNIIIDVVKDVFSTMLFTEIEVFENDDLKLNSPIKVSVFLGISGLKKYGVIIETDEKFAIKAASSMLGEDLNEWSDAVQDAIGEVSNMIAGNIKSKLPEKQNLSLSIPTVVKGIDYTYSTPKMRMIEKVFFKAFDSFMKVILIEEI